jgi:pimeloyl-ACP methyl ester carboxylesterase
VSAERIEALDGAVAVTAWDFGPKDGIPLLFWPGLGSYMGRSVEELADVLCEQGVRTIGIDPPGWAGTPLPPREAYEPAALAAIALSVADAARLEQVAFMGASWGATVALAAAVHAPQRVRSVVLVDGGYLEPSELDPLPDEDTQVAESVRLQVEWRFRDWDAFEAELRSHFGPLRPAAARAFRYGMLVDEEGLIAGAEHPVATVWSRIAMTTVPSSELLPVLARERVAAQLLAVRQGPDREPRYAAARERFARLLPGAEVHVLDGHHDLISTTPPEELAGLIVPFLRT